MKHKIQPALLLFTALILASCSGPAAPGPAVVKPPDTQAPVGIDPPAPQAPTPQPTSTFQPPCVGNLLQNPNALLFTPGANTNIAPFGPTLVPDWQQVVGSPQHSPTVGYDLGPGWLLGWGYKDGGESFAQTGLNLPAGTYTLSLGVRAFATTVAPYSKYKINFGTAPSLTPWTDPNPTIVSGSIPINLGSGLQGWDYQAHTFTLTAPLTTTMQVTTVNDNASAQVTGHPELVSWLGYDSFCLQNTDPVKLHRALSVRTLSNGNTVMVGSADALNTAPGTDLDFATVMYDVQGNILWSRIEHLSALTDEARDVALDSSENVVVVGVQGHTPGAEYDDSGAVMFKYDKNTGFPVVGFTPVVVDNPGIQDVFNSVEVDATNRIVTGGTDGNQLVPPMSGTGNWRSFKVRRYLSGGTPDPSFNGTGESNTIINPHFTYPPTSVPHHGPLEDNAGTLYDVAIQPDGKILAAGTTLVTEVFNIGFSTILRLDQNGVLDPNYGIDGIQTLALDDTHVLGTGDPRTRDTAVDSQFNRIVMQGLNAVLAGTVEKSPTSGANSSGPYAHCAVSRFDGNGNLDQSFGSGGATMLVFARCAALDLNASGSDLTVTGDEQAPGGNIGDVLVLKLDPSDGSVINRGAVVNPNGYAVATGASSGLDAGRGIAFNPVSNSFVIAGFTNKVGADDEWFASLLHQ